MKKTALLSISFISIIIFTMSLAVAHTNTLHFSSTGTDPCSVTFNQDLSFTIPNAIYDGGPLVGQMALKIDFQYFGEQNGQLIWKLGNIGTPSSSSSSCSVTIDTDLSFTLVNAIYDGGPLVGQMGFQADFKYSGEQNGAFLWYLADLKVNDTPSDPTPDPSPIVLSKTQVALELGNTETIFISGGTGYYTMNTSNSQVATAVISGSSLEVTGLSSGSATITVEDTGGETATILVVVASSTSPSGACGAYVAPGVWKQFDCYNLAAIGKTTSDDPFTPSWRLIGGYWQWGRKGPDSSQWYDTNTPHFVHGPKGPGLGDANVDSISGWDGNAPDGAWSDVTKSTNDPCPAGFRVPTLTQWYGVRNNNTQSSVGTWNNNDTNYSSAWFFDNDLMLPAAGARYANHGALYRRGDLAFYWSSTEHINGNAALLSISNENAGLISGYRRTGISVRCISE